MGEGASLRTSYPSPLGEREIGRVSAPQIGARLDPVLGGKGCVGGGYGLSVGAALIVKSAEETNGVANREGVGGLLQN